MKDVEAKKRGTDVLLEEMGAQRSEAEAQQVCTVAVGINEALPPSAPIILKRACFICPVRSI